MSEKEIVSFHATLETADGVTLNYKLKDYISMRYFEPHDKWFIKGVFEVKYGDEVYTVESDLSYSVRLDYIGSMWFKELRVDDWDLGTVIGQVYGP